MVLLSSAAERECLGLLQLVPMTRLVILNKIICEYFTMPPLSTFWKRGLYQPPKAWNLTYSSGSNNGHRLQTYSSPYQNYFALTISLLYTREMYMVFPLRRVINPCAQVSVLRRQNVPCFVTNTYPGRLLHLQKQWFIFICLINS